MGQYYKICNIDKREFLSPYDFGTGAKLLEFASFNYPSSILSALAILLADGNNRGGGDLRSENPIIGSWKFNRIVVTGDYADGNPDVLGCGGKDDANTYQLATIQNGWINVGIEVWIALMDDGYTCSKYAEYLKENYKRVYEDVPVALAFAHKDKQYCDNLYPILAEKAEQFFSKLFPEMGTDYYKTINGIVKYNGCGSRGHVRCNELEKMYEDMKKKEEFIAMCKNDERENEIRKIKKDLAEMAERVDKLL